MWWNELKKYSRNSLTESRILFEKPKLSEKPVAAGDYVAALHRARAVNQLLHNLAFFLVIAGVIIAICLVLFDRWRRGALVFGGTTVAAAFFRATISSQWIGYLRVRGRVSDTVWLGICGVAILWLANSIDALGTG